MLSVMLNSVQLRKAISKAVSKAISKKFGCAMGVLIEDIQINESDETDQVKVRINAELTLGRKEVATLLEKLF